MPRPLHFLMTPLGSRGDVHPYIGIGRVLRTRGHEVTLLAAEPHQGIIEGAGLGFQSIYPAEAYHAATGDPDIWHPRRGLGKVLEMAASGLDPVWNALRAHHQPGRTVLVGHPLSFATRAFEERTGAPAATLHLAPSSIRSAHQVPTIPPGVEITGWPLPLKRALWWLVDHAGVDPHIVPALNRWRATHDLPPVRRVFHSWLNSPRAVLGLFPEWFGPRQPDWPGAFAHAGFPLWDDAHPPTSDPALEAFLAGGAPPVVCSPGSANRLAHRFFAAATEALQRLGRRGLFLTGYPEQLPTNLPDSILHRHYLPFSTVLPRAAALVHHGGIGSTAQGLAAGVPQLIMPMGFDQPDNARRVERLGVARWLAPRRFTGLNVAGALELLLGDPGVGAAAAVARHRVRTEDGLERAATFLEQLASP